MWQVHLGWTANEHSLSQGLALTRDPIPVEAELQGSVDGDEAEAASSDAPEDSDAEPGSEAEGSGGEDSGSEVEEDETTATLEAAEHSNTELGPPGSSKARGGIKRRTASGQADRYCRAVFASSRENHSS